MIRKYSEQVARIMKGEAGPASTRLGEAGVALYLTMVIMGLVFALAMSVSAILLREIQISRDVARYTPALAAADAGLERALYEIRKNGAFASCQTTSACVIGSQQSPVATSNGGAYYVVVIDAGVDWCTVASQMCIRSFGSFQNTNRALEAAF